MKTFGFWHVLVVLGVLHAHCHKQQPSSTAAIYLQAQLPKTATQRKTSFGGKNRGAAVQSPPPPPSPVATGFSFSSSHSDGGVVETRALFELLDEGVEAYRRGEKDSVCCAVLLATIALPGCTHLTVESFGTECCMHHHACAASYVHCRQRKSFGK